MSEEDHIGKTDSGHDNRFMNDEKRACIVDWRFYLWSTDN